jgi:hypothetical protein
VCFVFYGVCIGKIVRIGKRFDFKHWQLLSTGNSFPVGLARGKVIRLGRHFVRRSL